MATTVLCVFNMNLGNLIRDCRAMSNYWCACVVSICHIDMPCFLNNRNREFNMDCRQSNSQLTDVDLTIIELFSNRNKNLLKHTNQPKGAVKTIQRISYAQDKDPTPDSIICQHGVSISKSVFGLIHRALRWLILPTTLMVLGQIVNLKSIINFINIMYPLQD